MARVILIADDSPIIQRKAQKILEDEGFEVETVSNGVAAVKKLPGLRPALVLADVSMPGKDGYEVCEFVKNSTELQRVPVLLVGSDLEPYDEQRGAQVKADGIIKKPFTPHELISMVEQLTRPGEGAKSEPPSDGTSAASSPASAPAAPPEEPIGDSPEPGQEPAESFPVSGVASAPEPASEPVPEAASKPVWADIESRPQAEEAGSGGIQETSPVEVGDWLVAPQLIDSPTVREVVPEPDSGMAARAPDPLSEFVLDQLLVRSDIRREAEESSRPATEEPEPREVGGLIPTPPLIDSPTGPETGPETGAAVQELSLEPAPETAPEPGSREAEEARSAGVEEPASRGVDDNSTTAQPPSRAASEAVESSPAPPPIPLDPDLIYAVVQKAVTKMAPPVLSPQQIEEIARSLAREISAELEAPS